MMNRKTDPKTEKLVRDLKAVKKPLLDHMRRDALKKQILNQLDVPVNERVSASYDSVVYSIRRAVSDFKLTRVKRASIKEKVFALIESHSQKRFFWANFFAFHKKLISAALVFVLVFGFFSFVNVETGVVRAATFTKLDFYSGGVLVERFGEFVDVTTGMRLYEDDQIITGDDGTAVIAYFDDSVSRLAGNSHLLIRQLEKPKETSVESYVEVLLLDGNLWSKVVNLVGKDSSFVVVAEDVYASTRKAAFNVKIDEEALEIGVYNSRVDLRLNEGTDNVVSGEKVVVEKKSKKVAKSKIEESEKEDKWVKDNLKSDRQYLTEVEQRLLVAKMKAVGVTVEDDVDFETGLRANTMLFLTFDDIKKKKVELDLSEEKFIAAQIKLHDKNLTEEQNASAKKAVENFVKEVSGFYDLVKEVSYTDDDYAEELRTYVDEKVIAHKKDLSVVLPDSPLYQLKPVMDELELLTAKDEGEVLTLKANHVAEKLAVAQDISDKDKNAKQVVRQAIGDYKEVIGMIEVFPEGESSALKTQKAKLVKDVTAELQLFEATSIVNPNELSELKNEVAKVSGVPVAAESLGTTSGVVEKSGEDGDAEPESEEDEDPFAEPEPETIVEGPFGVEVKGDKPLPPELQGIE